MPGYFGDVKRYQDIEVHYIDRHNKKKKLKAEGFLARIIQHEIDHLDGILFIEKVEAAYRVKDEAAEVMEEAAADAKKSAGEAVEV